MSEETLRSSKFVAPDFDEEQMRKAIDDAIAGNISSKIDLVLHNQAILNSKLEVLLAAELTRMTAKEIHETA